MLLITKILLTGIGGVCVVLGFIGLVIPFMPGFVFFAIAVVCLSSASPALHRKLSTYPQVRRFLQELEQTRGSGIVHRLVGALGSAARLLGGSFGNK